MAIDDPSVLLIQTAQALRQAEIPVALYGGLANAAYGTPRETRDVDYVSQGLFIPKALECLEARYPDALRQFEREPFGGLYMTRITILDREETGGESRLAHNLVDFLEPMDPDYTERLMGRVIQADFLANPIEVISPEDFVIVKVLSTRDRDLEDAVGVLDRPENDGKLDYALIENEITALDQSIAHHPVRERWETVKSRIGVDLDWAPGMEP